MNLSVCYKFFNVRAQSKNNINLKRAIKKEVAEKTFGKASSSFTMKRFSADSPFRIHQVALRSHISLIDRQKGTPQTHNREIDQKNQTAFFMQLITWSQSNFVHF